MSITNPVSHTMGCRSVKFYVLLQMYITVMYVLNCIRNSTSSQVTEPECTLPNKVGGFDTPGPVTVTESSSNGWRHSSVTVVRLEWCRHSSQSLAASPVDGVYVNWSVKGGRVSRVS